MKRMILIAVITALAISSAVSYASAVNVVNIDATVNTKIVVTAPADIDFGTVDPGSGIQTQNGDVNVRSNTDFELSRAEADVSGSFDASGDAKINTTNPFVKAPGVGGVDITETYTFDAGDDLTVWADAGALTASYTYTAIAD